MGRFLCARFSRLENIFKRNLFGGPLKRTSEDSFSPSNSYPSSSFITFLNCCFQLLISLIGLSSVKDDFRGTSIRKLHSLRASPTAATPFDRFENKRKRLGDISRKNSDTNIIKVQAG